jgi:hypothetical protein
MKDVLYAKIYNSQNYSKLWNNEDNINIIRQTLREKAQKAKNQHNSMTATEAYDKTLKLDNTGLKLYIETKLNQKLFIETFTSLINV